MQENLVISDNEFFDRRLNNLILDGADNFIVIADFGRTLTKCFNDGKRISTSWSSIRNDGYLGEEYKKRALEYFEKYHPIEIDKDISLDEKIKILTEWWKLHLELLIEFGFNLNVINDLIKKGKVPLREGISEFLDLLKSKNIPLVIVSQGLSDIYIQSLKNIGKLYDNVYFVSNLFDFDENGKAIKIKGMVIHPFNKNNINFENFYFFNKIKNRKNVLLLGDDIEDTGMIRNYEHKNLIKIGFLNENADKNLETFKKNFDALILNDSTMDFVNELIEKIV